MPLNKTIGFRLLRYVFGCYFAVAVVVTSVQLVSEYVNVKENIFNELSHLGKTLEDSLARSIWNYNIEQAQATLLGIGKIAMVSGTRVTGIEDESFASSGLELKDSDNVTIAQEGGKFGTGRIRKIHYFRDGQENTLYEYKFPLRYVDENGSVDELIGYSYLYANHSVIIDRVKYGFILIIINSLIKTAALWFIFLFFTKRIVAKPLGLLTDATRALDPSNPAALRNSGELESLPPTKNDDEIKILTSSFLKMRDAIAEKIDVIEDQNATLEQRVATRTANLTEANTKLEQEIVQRSRAEKSLRIYREIILNTNEAIIVCGADGRIIKTNPACEQNTGYSRDELLGQYPDFLRSDHHDDEFFHQIQEVIRSEGHWDGEIWNRKKNGEEIPHWVVINPIYDEQGEILHLIGLYRDISELKQTEARLSQAQKLESIGQLSAGVAHEINTPTQFVGDNIRFLETAFEDLSEVQHAYHGSYEAAKNQADTTSQIKQVETVLEQADSEYLAEEIPVAIRQSIDGVSRIAKIVGAMKAFSHMGAENKEQADLNAAISNTLTVASNEWKYVADINLDLDEALPTVPCYPAEFNQIVLNLVVNAAHAIKDVVDDSSGEKGVISISSRLLEHEVEVRIGDTGSGIPEAVRDKIFDPFFTTKEVGKGTGQGLSIVHSTVVEKHGGALEFETEIGKGTTFVIRLPLAQGEIVQEDKVALASA